MLWRGTFFLLIGQAVSLLAGYGINVLLARRLGPERYGVFGIVQSILLIVELSVIAGVPHALKRFIGENRSLAFSLHRVLLPAQMGFALVLLVSVFALSPAIARLLRTPEIANLLQIALIDIVFFGAYWYYIGFLNGQQRFGPQTIVVSAYTISKFIFVVALVSLGWGVLGAFVGNILGSAVGMATGMLLMKYDREQTAIDRATLWQFIAPSILYAIAINLIFYVDLWTLKRHFSGALIGFYTAASTLAKIPYFFSAALTGTILPVLSQALADRAQSEVRRIIQQSTRLSLLVLLPAAIFVASEAPAIVQIFFGSAYVEAAMSLRILFPSICGLTILAVFNTMSMAKQGMTACSLILILSVVLDGVLNMLLVPEFGAVGAAAATALTVAFGLVASSILLWRHFGMISQATTLRRLIAANMLLLGAALAFPVATIVGAAAKIAVLNVVYFLLLLATGEITRTEIDKLRSGLISLFIRK